MQADLIINRLRMEASVERQRAVFEIDDDVPIGRPTTHLQTLKAAA